MVGNNIFKKLAKTNGIHSALKIFALFDSFPQAVGKGFHVCLDFS